MRETEDDAIIQELRRIKRALAKQYDYDIKRLCDALRREQDASRATTVAFRPKKLKGHTAAA